MGIRSLLGLPVAPHQEIVVRPRPSATGPTPFATKVAGPAVILVVAVIGMSQLAAATGSLPRQVVIAMATSPRTSPLLGVPSAPAPVVEPVPIAALPTAVEAVADVREPAQPVLAVVNVVLRKPVVAAAPRSVARKPVVAAAPRSVARKPVVAVAPRSVARKPVVTVAPRSVAAVVAALLLPGPAVAPAPAQRVRGKSRLQTESASVVKNRPRTYHIPTSFKGTQDSPIRQA